MASGEAGEPAQPGEQAAGEEPLLPFPVGEALLETVGEAIAESMPEIAGAVPEVHAKGERVVLLYKLEFPAQGGQSHRRTVRAVINAEGEIVKLSASRG
jgi:hypothetical protein